MKNLMFSVLTIFLLASAQYVKSQNALLNVQPNMYSAKELKEDYSILRTALQTIYPSLYRFTDSINMTNYLDNNLRSIDHAESETEFYKLIATACARVNDEHLIPKPSKDYYNSLKTTNHFLPFSLKIIDRRLYVFKTSLSNGEIPAGAEIISINGHSAEDILNILLPTIPSDGYIQTFNTRHLEDYSMTEEENLFDLNYPIFFEDTENYRIEFTTPGERSIKKVVSINGLDERTYKQFLYTRMPLKAPLEFKYLKKDIAYLRISSFLRWHRNRFKQDFNVLYDSVFNQLTNNHTKNLILDLRNNEGGDGTGETLLKYLMNKPYRHFADAEYKFTGKVPLGEYLENANDLSIPDSLVDKDNNGLYRVKKIYMPLLGIQQPFANNFRGNLYVLINGASGSMATVVAAFLKGNGRGIFIGEESGGTMEGNTSHQSAKLILPHTKFKISIPLLKTTNAVHFEKGRGVIPHYSIAHTINDLQNGEDMELNFSLHLIDNEKD